jgi:hypothetical protein
VSGSLFNKEKENKGVSFTTAVSEIAQLITNGGT